MNKHYIKYFSVLMILFILQSCCTKEYLIGDIQRSFSFVDAATNNDLIYGDNKLWDKDSILIKYSSADAYNKIGQYLYSKYQDSSVVINFDNHDTCL